MSLTKVTNSMISGAVANILDYGAIAGDASKAAANSVAIQAAMNSGGAVVIPIGNFYFDTSLVLPYTLDMQGQNRHYSQLTFTGTGNAIVDNGARGFRHHLARFWLTCNNAANVANGISITHYPTYILLEELDIWTFGAGGIFLDGGTWNTIRKCDIKNINTYGASPTAAWGIRITDTSGVSATTTVLEDNYISFISNTAGTGTGIVWQNCYNCTDLHNITESLDIGRSVSSCEFVRIDQVYYEANITDLVWHDSSGYVVGGSDPNPIATWDTVPTSYRYVGWRAIETTSGAQPGSVQGHTRIVNSLDVENGYIVPFLDRADNNLVYDPDNFQLLAVAPLTTRTYTLSKASTVPRYTASLVKYNDAGSQVITPFAGDTISGLSSYTLNHNGEYVFMVSDGVTDWKVFGSGGIKQPAIADVGGETETNKVKAALRAFGIISV